MLYPSIFNDSLFDDFFNFPEIPAFPQMPDVDRKLYGKNASHVMKTDVREHDDMYEVDLPGFKKDEISLELTDGYLTIKAAKGLDEEKTDKKGKLIRQERYAGSMQRSFFIGENVTEEEVKAKFENGVLKLCIPKKAAKKIPEKKTISIEG